MNIVVWIQLQILQMAILTAKSLEAYATDLIQGNLSASLQLRSRHYQIWEPMGEMTKGPQCRGSCHMTLAGRSLWLLLVRLLVIVKGFRGHFPNDAQSPLRPE